MLVRQGRVRHKKETNRERALERQWREGSEQLSRCHGSVFS